MKRYRLIFIGLGCLLIFCVGVWTGRSARVKRLTSLIPSYIDLSYHDVTAQIAPGVQHRQMRRQGVLTNLLELSPEEVMLLPHRGLDAGIGTESLASLVHRHQPLAAINGGYFEMKGTFRGESVGALKIDGQWMSEPEQRRAAIGLSMVDGKVEAIIDRIELQIELVLQNGETLEIDGINRARIENELILYRPIFHPVTLTDADGVEVVVRKHHVVGIWDGQGSLRIPEDGYVLSANDAKRDWVLIHMTVGERVRICETVIPEKLETQKQWQAAEHIIGGGPLLLRDGEPTPSEAHDAEGFERSFYGWPHPRTAIGIKADETLMLVTISAAAPKVRRGVTLAKLARLLSTWGARDALNLDGGESTTMIIDDRIVSQRMASQGEKTQSQGNHRIRPYPADVGRPIADALLIFQRQE